MFKLYVNDYLFNKVTYIMIELDILYTNKLYQIKKIPV